MQNNDFASTKICYIEMIQPCRGYIYIDLNINSIQILQLLVLHYRQYSNEAQLSVNPPTISFLPLDSFVSVLVMEELYRAGREPQKP